MSDIGHNSASQEELKTFVERIERLHAERQSLAGDVADLYAEAKAGGFDAKILRQCVKIRQQGLSEYNAQRDILDLYLGLLGPAPSPHSRFREGSHQHV